VNESANDSMMYKILVFIFVFSISIVLSAQNATAEFIQEEVLDGASKSVVFFDLVTGEELEFFNKDLKLCPASTWKLLTVSAAGLELSNKPFKTELIIEGDIKEGVLEGNVVIRGYGDPTFGSKVFNEDPIQVLSDWANLIRQEGITQINGKILADDSWLKGLKLPRTRIWEDMANYYGAHLSGLNFHDNSYTITFNTEFDPGEEVKLLRCFPEVPNLNIESEVTASTIRYDRAFIFGSPLSANRVVRGTLPIGYDSYEIEGSLPDPALFCAFHMRNLLTEIGIRSDGFGILKRPLSSKNKLIASLNSPDLNEIIRGVLVDSNNLFAEALMAKIGEKKGNGSLEAGAKEIVEFYSEHCHSGNSIHGFDGSGLSRFNAISAGQFQHLISYCNKNQELRKLVLLNLPVFGQNGTVKRMGKGTPLEGNVAAKSGSMTGVLAYCGLFNALSGRQVGFSIMVNNFESPTYKVRNSIEDLILKVYKHY